MSKLKLRKRGWRKNKSKNKYIPTSQINYLEIQAYNDGTSKQINKENTNIRINDFPISAILKPSI